jgi:hypothetical protein
MGKDHQQGTEMYIAEKVYTFAEIAITTKVIQGIITQLLSSPPESTVAHIKIEPPDNPGEPCVVWPPKLEAEPGQQVTICNTTAQTVTIKFGTGAQNVFGIDVGFYTLSPEQCIVFTVAPNAEPGADAGFSVDCAEGNGGGPKIIIVQPPGSEG